MSYEQFLRDLLPKLAGHHDDKVEGYLSVARVAIGDAIKALAAAEPIDRDTKEVRVGEPVTIMRGNADASVGEAGALALEALRLHDVYETTPTDRGGSAGAKGQARARWECAKAHALATAALSQPPARADDEVERCFICGEPFKAGDMVLPDIECGLGHRACFGDDRDAFVKDVDTGEPLGPDDPLPTGRPWTPLSPARAEGEPDVGAGWTADDARRYIENWCPDYVKDYIDALASPPAPGGEGWRLIETAPKDGTEVLAWPCNTKEGDVVCKARWYVHPSVQAWDTDEIDCNDYDFSPTHWMPLPAAPKPEERSS